MNERQKYINDLSIYLRQLADEERNDALEFYDEYIADAGLETRTAIEERLGTPRLLAAGGVALSLIVGIVALIFGVAVIAIVSLYIGIGLLATNLFSGLFYLGLGVTLIGLFLVCLPLIYWLIRVIVQGIANFAKFIYAKVQARRKK